MDASSGRGLTLALCTGALLMAGCSSSNSADTGAGDDAGYTDDSSVATEDAATGPGQDATVPVDSGSARDSSTPTDAPVVTDSATTKDASEPADASETDAQADADEDTGEDAGNPGTIPAAVAIWEFQDAPGSTTAVDSSGNGHTATLEGTAAIVSSAPQVDAGTSDSGNDDGGNDDGGASDAGDAGGAYSSYLQIDGTSGAFADVTGGPLFDNSKSFTVSAWVSFPSFNDNYDELISADGANVSVFELQLAPLTGPDGGTGYFSEAAFPTADTPTPGAYYYGFSTAQPAVGTWYHLVGVYDLSGNPGLLSLYVNGVLQSNPGDSRSLGANPVAAVGDFIIGAGKYDNARTNGAVANYMGVRVYAQALTAAQVATLYGLNGR